MNNRITKLFGHQIFVSPSAVVDLPPADHPEVDTSLRLWCVDAPKHVDVPKPDAPVLSEEVDPTLELSLGPSRGFRNNHRPYVCMDHAWLHDNGHHGTTSNNPVTTPAAAAAADSSSSSSTHNTAPRRPIIRRRGANDDEATPEPRAPCSELVQRMGPGIEPVFLYRKKLELCHTLRTQNKLSFNRTEKLKGFLSEEERVAVFDPVLKLGIEVVAIDRMGREYEMRLKTWGKVTVVMQQWWNMVRANGVQVHQWVHLWGYRMDDGKFRLAVEFRDEP